MRRAADRRGFRRLSVYILRRVALPPPAARSRGRIPVRLAGDTTIVYGKDNNLFFYVAS